MKQTNNAIKFLMAQYRAIFQNAYFKGLATAAVVTMGLAAGQAQATAPTLTDLANQGELKFTAAEKVAITGKGTNPWKADVKVTGINSSTAHSIKADGGALSLSGSGSLTVQTGKATDGISLAANAISCFSSLYS